jgi:SPP1 family predicted phage head-tail adaptor
VEYSEIIYLISTVKTEDEIGNIINSSETSTKCYAKKQSVKTNEFYSAVEVGLTPSCEFVVKRLNYNGEDEIEWNNKRFSVIRVVEPKNKFDIVLVCSVKIGGYAKEPSSEPSSI